MWQSKFRLMPSISIFSIMTFISCILYLKANKRKQQKKERNIQKKKKKKTQQQPHKIKKQLHIADKSSEIEQLISEI